MDFFAFDKAYLDKLRAGDAATQHHFASYFGRFLRIRLRARRLAPDKIDDLVQDTLLKVIVKVHQELVVAQNIPRHILPYLAPVPRYRLLCGE